MTISNTNENVNMDSGNSQTQGNAGGQKPYSVAGIVNTFGGRSRLAAADAEVGKVQKNFADYFEKNQNDAILRSYKAIPVSPQQTGNFGALALTNIRVVGTTLVIFV